MTDKLNELKYVLNSFALDVTEVTDNAVRITAFDVLNKATKLLTTQTFGTYQIRYPRDENGKATGGKPYYHIASKEGDAPNTDTGRLVDSIAVAHDRRSMIAEVGTNVTYGAVLETTLNRPWLIPAKDAAVAKFQKNITRAIETAIKKAVRRAKL